MTDSAYISELEAKLASRDQQIQLLEEKLHLLLEVLQKSAIKKDSRNSSFPPSSDLFRKTKSLRPASVKKSGGQIGHSGSTLEMCSAPDKITELKPAFCKNCGASLSAASFELKAKRQVIELPPIVPICEEFRQYTCQCPSCLVPQLADFPRGVHAPIQYGSSVESLVSYFSAYQYVPFARLQDLFEHVFSLPLSQGTIGNVLERSAEKCEGIYQHIKSQIRQSEVVGSDETSARVNGDNWWVWVWQNIRNTFIACSKNRGSETINSIWKEGLPNSVLVSDRWAAHLKVNTKGHQICLAHLLRNLNFLEESEKHAFSDSFKELIAAVFDIRKKRLLEKKSAFQVDDPEAMDLEKKLNSLLLITIDRQKHPNTAIFQASMIKNRNHLLPCLYNFEVPPDNNASERAIRNIKVKQKVSGQFKSGQNSFCVIRSVIDTLRKRNVQVLPCLNLICKLQPE
jgi:transposase